MRCDTTGGQRRPVIDVEVEDFGTILQILGRSARGRRWLRQHVDGGQAVVQAEHRMGWAIVDGLYEAGLSFVKAERPGVVYGRAR